MQGQARRKREQRESRRKGEKIAAALMAVVLEALEDQCM